jgi:hypothetical protein
MTTSTTASIATANGGAVLWSVNVNTGGSGAILKIYNDTTSATASNCVATIACTNQGSFWYGIRCPNGIFAAISVANADVTIGYQ